MLRPPATCSQESIMLYKVALTRVTTRVASNTPIRMAPFDSLDHYHRTESTLDSLIALDVPSESKYQRHNRHASAPRLASQRRVGDTRVVLSTLPSSNKRRLLVFDRTTRRSGTKRILDHRPKTRLFEVPFVEGARTARQQGCRWSVLISSLSRRRHPCSTSTFPMR